MVQEEHCALLSTFVKLPFVIKIFVLSIFSGRFTQVLLYSGDNVDSCYNSFSLLAMSIHMSNSTKVLLERFETFSIQERGIIEVKVRNCRQTVSKSNLYFWNVTVSK